MEAASKIKRIEQEIESLKMMEKSENLGKNIISLKGALVGISITEEEINEAKKSVFKLSS